PLEMAGKTTTIDLAAHNATKVLARASTTVICGNVPKQKKPFFAPLFPPLLTAIGVIPIAPPPSLVQPTTSTQAQSQAQAQGAFAAQEQEQPQVAFATAYKRALDQALVEEREYSMTAYRDRSAPAMPPPLFIASVGIMSVLAYVGAIAPRRRLSRAAARNRRR
ncbi:MAG TPA: hypothetical protein VFK89_11400, partial [Actinomycetota bacterium]|nr:hypothetical protein [Actinomycetota bacterium]